MRAKNMQALTGDIQRRWPGVVIYGKGDAAHQGHASDHNEDDTAGSRPAQTDGDSVPEHRAIDVMLGPAFTKADGDQLVADLLADPDARKRLMNIIWCGGIWSRSWGWTRRTYTGTDQHKNHPHISGWAPDDENAAGWPAVNKGGVTDVWCKHGETSMNVRYVQFRLSNLGFDVGKVDSNYGDKTAAALKAACLKQYKDYAGDGKAYEADEAIYLDALWDKKLNQPLLDQIAALEKKLAALVAAPTPASQLPSAIVVKGGTLQIGAGTLEINA